MFLLRFPIYIFFAATVACIYSCSGGGGGTGPISPPGGSPATPSIAGVALDGYLYNAVAFLDRNGNAQLDAGEPWVKTASDGTFSLSVSTSDVGQYPVVIKAVTGETIDQDNPGNAINSDFVLIGLKDSPQVVSPLTTLVAVEIKANPNLNVQQAQENVKQSLGLGNSTVSLVSDYGNTRNIAAAPELIKLRNHAPLVVSKIQEVLRSNGNVLTSLDAAAQDYKQAIARNDIPANLINGTHSLSFQQISSMRQTLAPAVQSLSTISAPTVTTSNGGGSSSATSSSQNTGGNSSGTSNSSSQNSNANNSGATNPAPPAVTYSLSGVTDAAVTTSVLLKLVASDGSTPADITWTVDSPDITVTQATVGTDQLRISLASPQSYKKYSVEVSAKYNGSTYKKTVRFLPGFAYNEPSSKLALTHSHSTYAYLFGAGLAPVGGGSKDYFNAFDENGWVNRQIEVDFDGFRSNGSSVYDNNYFFRRYDPFRKKSYSLYPHRTDDKLVFMTLDENTLTGNYKILDFGMSANTYGGWGVIGLADCILLSRTVLTDQIGQDSKHKKINVVVYKLDYDGNIVSNKTIETANIPGFGYSQQYTGGTSPAYLPSIELVRHYDDVLVSGFVSNFKKDTSVTLASVHDLWIPIKVSDMTLKSPFWIKADRFRSASYVEQPSLSFYTYEWGWSLNTSKTTAWQPKSSFVIRSWFSGYQALNINQGWYEAKLASDYSAISMTTYGSKKFDATDSNAYSHSWRNGESLAVYKSTSTPSNTMNAYVGNRSTLYQLPPLNAGLSTCNLYWQLYGLFNYGTDCNKFESYYGFKASSSEFLVREFPSLSAFYLDSAYEYLAGSRIDGMNANSLHLNYKSNEYKGIDLDLDSEFMHPGCTVAKPSYTPPTIPISSNVETASVEKVSKPALLTAPAVTTTSGALTVTVTPYQFRAPVLCSQYKISLDQTLTMSRSTTATKRTVSPVLHSYYSRQQLTAPANGTYDALTNQYSPNVGFSGTDTFKIRINDTTGEQDVTVVVRVY